jgi:hypothetical protein
MAGLNQAAQDAQRQRQQAANQGRGATAAAPTMAYGLPNATGQSNSQGSGSATRSGTSQCTQVSTVSLMVKDPTGPGHCDHESVLYFSNHSTEAVDCVYVWYKGGVPSSGMAENGLTPVGPGQQVGGEEQGDWACGVDIPSRVKYACFRHSQEVQNLCTAKVQW